MGQAVAAKTELESSLSQLDHDLGRNSDIGRVQVDSEESAEVFQIRNQVRYRRSPSPKKKSKEKKSRESKSSTMKIHVIGVFILLDYVTTKVKFFRSNHDLSKVGSHESKFHQAVAAKTELESSLSQLDHDLGRNSDIGSVQVDS